MEDHPIVFLVIIIMGIGYALYYTFLVIVMAFLMIYRFIIKIIKGRRTVNNNVID